MFGAATAYAVAVVMILFCALAAFVIIATVDHFDDSRVDSGSAHH
jgi:hypothetical protein